MTRQSLTEQPALPVSKADSDSKADSEIERIKNVYTHKYSRQAATDVAYIWNPLNPVAVYFRQAREKAIIELLRRANLSLEELRILDVGCGGGSLLAFLCSIHADPAKMAGVDLMPERVQRARQMCPSAVHLMAADAQHLPFSTASFDLVCQFTMLSSILDDEVKRQVASEMRRVLAPGGYILWYDLIGGVAPETRGIPEFEIAHLLPGMTKVEARMLHPVGTIRLACHSTGACHLLDNVPFWPKTNLLALLRAGSAPLSPPPS